MASEKRYKFERLLNNLLYLTIIKILFTGCIKSFYIDEKLIDFLQASHQKPGVLAGCFQRYLDGTINDDDKSDRPSLLREQKIDNKNKRKKGCKENKCRTQGTRKCSPKGRRDYKCQCRRGYAGRYCERGN